MAHNPYAMWPQVRNRACASSPLRSTRFCHFSDLAAGALSRPALTSYFLAPLADHDEPLRHRRPGHVPGIHGTSPALAPPRTANAPLAFSARFRANAPLKKQDERNLESGRERRRDFFFVRGGFPDRRLTRRPPPFHRRATTRRRLPARTARRLARPTPTASAATLRRSGSSSTRRLRLRRRRRLRRRTAAPRRPPPARRGPATGTPVPAKCGWTSAS
jgi:hypothetical protein